MFLTHLSDIHLEFEAYDNNGGRKYPSEYFTIPKRPTNKDTILILAGDIGLANNKHTLFPFLEECSRQFPYVLYVPGNHEYYGSSMLTVPDKIMTGIAEMGLSNVHFLLNKTITIAGHKFIGTTLWTDYNKRNPADILAAQFAMTDFKVIRTGTKDDPYLKKLSPYDLIVQHDNAVAFLTSELKDSCIHDIPTVVITHHLPSYKSVHPKYDGEQLNSSYASDLDQLIMDYGPKYWFHGHTHDSTDYMLFNTKVMCNPRGYLPNDLNEDFEVDWLIPL